MRPYSQPRIAVHCGRLLTAFSFPIRNQYRLNFHLRLLHDDGRRRLSAFWAPTGGIAYSAIEQEDSHSLLIRGGFMRQSHSGFFQLLPLGLRIQEKIEKLLDKHMVKVGASKVSLSTFSTEDLWEKSGRLKKGSSELFRLQDRKETKFLLSPTHEEEITAIVRDIVHSYKELPLRLYQITRKYRDEPRPRQGLLRTREFLMKDLYTFDTTKEKALETYETVRRTYSAFFDEFKIPYLIAEADSGDIGGNLSHEYHLPSQKGEDSVISCSSCSYTANEEMATSAHISTARKSLSDDIDPSKSISSDDPRLNSTLPVDTYLLDHFPYKRWFGVSKDRATVFVAIYPAEIEDFTLPNEGWRKTELNPYVLKRLSKDLDLRVEHHAGDRKANQIFREFFDYRLPQSFINAYLFEQGRQASRSSSVHGNEGNIAKPEERHRDDNFDLIKISTGDACPKCSKRTLQVQRAVELGHTFHLGTRYSGPLKATFAIDRASRFEVLSTEDDDSFLPSRGKAHMQMGCHGIGVSRIIAAVADFLADAQGLNWPRVIAPFETIIIPAKGLESVAVQAYDLLRSVSFDGDDGNNGKDAKENILAAVDTATVMGGIDVILDDRDKSLAWKFKDADLIGYPVMVVVGRSWLSKSPGLVEVQCRRLGFKKEVRMHDLRRFVTALLDRL
ncbi:hypothetical protein MMC07_008889 [Pseudocyphellaria aurata]|nr:hypothetical protein [Pseudocyphellaria aurata]